MECKTLSDICLRICSGGTPKRSCREYYDGGTIPWLNTAEVNFNRIRSTASHITEQGLDNSSARWVPKDTVIVAMYGATAGRVAIAGIPLTTNQACCNLVIDCALADPKYVYYWLKNKYCEIAGLANGGAQQNLGVSVLKEVEIVLPTLSVQHAVADYLAVLDEKIELNSRINDHLGELLSIEFDRLLRGATQRKLLIDVMDVLSGGTPKTSNPEYWVGGNIPLFSPRDATESPYVLETEKSITEEGLNNCNSALYPANTVFLTARGTVGKIVLAGKPMAMNQSCFALHGRTIPQSVVYQAIRNTISALKLKANGATFAAINTRDLRSETLILPTPEDVDWYDSFAKPIWASILANESECCRLRETRDALLPKLMSGEVDVSRIDLKQLNGHLFES